MQIKTKTPKLRLVKNLLIENAQERTYPFLNEKAIECLAAGVALLLEVPGGIQEDQMVRFCWVCASEI